MPPSLDYKQQPAQTPDADVFALLPLLSHTSSVILVSFLVVWLALVFPWTGGPIPGGFATLFYLTVAVSLYAFMRGYLQIFRRGLGGWDMFMWGAAILVTAVLSIDIIIFGASITHTPIVFPGSAILSSPIVFFAVVIAQALYFLIESIVIALGDFRGRLIENWSLAIYLFALSVNSIAVLIGLFILGYYRLIW